MCKFRVVRRSMRWIRLGLSSRLFDRLQQLPIRRSTASRLDPHPVCLRDLLRRRMQMLQHAWILLMKSSRLWDMQGVQTVAWSCRHHLRQETQSFLLSLSRQSTRSLIYSSRHVWISGECCSLFLNVIQQNQMKRLHTEAKPLHHLHTEQSTDCTSASLQQSGDFCSECSGGGCATFWAIASLVCFYSSEQWLLCQICIDLLSFHVITEEFLPANELIHISNYLRMTTKVKMME